MRIGILTYHRAENYGALLQAYALKTYLQRRGFEVSYVDYWPKYHSDYFSIFPLQSFNKANVKGKISIFVRFLLWGIPRYIRKHRLQKFMHEHLGLPKYPKIIGNDSETEYYEVVVYGSDQIWRKQNLGGVGFDSWYFGMGNVQSKRKVVYAGSMGAVRFESAEKSYVLQNLKNFDVISVREKDLQDFLSTNGIKSQLVCDPVFLLTREMWQEVASPCSIKKKYILFYNLLNSRESVDFTNSLAQETGFPVVEINKVLTISHFLNGRYVSCASVKRFLSLVRDAEYVVSNSFHGVAFSILFQKQFYAVGMGQKANRVLTLLNNLGIKDRYYMHPISSLNDRRTINYEEVNRELRKLVNKSKQYLHSSVDNVECLDD